MPAVTTSTPPAVSTDELRRRLLALAEGSDATALRAAVAVLTELAPATEPAEAPAAAPPPLVKTAEEMKAALAEAAQDTRRYSPEEALASYSAVDHSQA